MKIFFHMDLDAFFCSVEEKYNPDLKGKAFAVGGNNSRSVIGSANYEARKFGIKAGMNIIEARRLCPHLVLTYQNSRYYSLNSAEFFEEVFSMLGMNVQIFSIDECWVEVTHLCKNTSPIEIANKFQKHVQKKLNLNVSIGISHSMFLAKMASDLEKPLGISTLFRNEIAKKIHHLPIESVFGLGNASSSNYREMGLKTLEDYKIYLSSKNDLTVYEDVLLKKLNGEYIGQIDSSMNNLKSVGNSMTLPFNTSSYSDAVKALRDVFELSFERMEIRSLFTRTIGVEIKNSNFETKRRQVSIQDWTNKQEILWSKTMECLDYLWKKQEVRLLGVHFANVIHEYDLEKQLSMGDEETKSPKAQKIAREMNKIIPHTKIKVLSDNISAQKQTKYK